ncbi:hypothetical protein [Streptomyces sp. NPDC059863]|uniref:hypothetical protein n=1 Tax=unclassified Streptomyces TaxID=2593676 RepID=UPI00365A6681
MRADNSRHTVDAARRRSEYTRAKAVQALRTLDTAGEPVTFENVAKQARVPRSWLTPSRTCARRSSDYRQLIVAAQAPRFPHGSAPATLRCFDASKQRTPASGASPRRTNNFAGNSPVRSANNAPRRLVPDRHERSGDLGSEPAYQVSWLC